MTDYLKAIDFVKTFHGPLKRKLTGESYAGHLLRVGNIVYELGGTSTQELIGLLHDSVEDIKGINKTYILTHWGPDVMRGVEYLTEDSSLGWYERKVSYLTSVLFAPREIQEVFLADKYDNISAILDWIEKNPDTDLSEFGGGILAVDWFWTNIKNYTEKMPKFSDRFQGLREDFNLKLNELLAYTNKRINELRT